MAKKKEVEVVEPAPDFVDVKEACCVWINGTEYKVRAGKQMLPEMVENVLRDAGKL